MLADESAVSIRVDDLPPTRRSLRVAVVTETYPPEVNGVARKNLVEIDPALLSDEIERVNITLPRRDALRFHRTSGDSCLAVFQCHD